MIAKTTLATANQNRDYRIFEDFAFYMMKEVCEKRTINILNISEKKYALDSITILLCLATFSWATFRNKKGEGEGLCLIWHWSTSSCLLYYNHCIKARLYSNVFLSGAFRFVRYYDEEVDHGFTYLRNVKQLFALDIANLYKKRWLIELFFKWLKQHLKIKKFCGATENAVRIHISIASNMKWSWNVRPMKFCRFSAYHWLTKSTYVTCSTRLMSMKSKI